MGNLDLARRHFNPQKSADHAEIPPKVMLSLYSPIWHISRKAQLGAVMRQIHKGHDQ